MYLTSFVNMGLLKRQPPPEVNPAASKREAWRPRENLIVGAMPRIRDGAGAGHGVGGRTSGGGSIFNSPVLASSASLRGDNPRPCGNNPRRVVASTRRADVRRPKAAVFGRRQPPSGGCFAREVCEPHVDSLSFVNMGLLKRQPPPGVIPRRKQARTSGDRRQPPPEVNPAA